MSLLDARGVTKTFAGITALNDVSLDVDEREIVGLIGPNGAGKTTAFNVLTGVYLPTAGTVRVAGEVVNGLKPHQMDIVFQVDPQFRARLAQGDDVFQAADGRRRGAFRNWRRRAHRRA